MSLQVWLPLNGSLENLGLDSFNFTQSIASGYEDGKIGKALQMKNSNVDFIVPSLINAKEFSVAFWYKAIADSTITTNWNKVLRFQTKNADGTSGSDFRFESSYAGSYATANYALSVHNNTTQSLGSIGHEIVNSKGAWHHVCFTHTPDDNYTYLDGVQIRYGAGAAGTLTGRVIIAGASPYPNGLMNDLRIYDHCLSQKEVKELSKGLVAHYPLNDFVGNPNLVSYVIAGGRTTVLGKYAVKTTGENLDTYFRFNTIEPFDSGSTYTISMDVENLAYNNGLVFSVGDQSTTSDKYCGRISLKNGHNTFTFTCPSGLNDLSQSILDDVNRGGAVGQNVLISNFKLEKGSVATPWIPNIQDDLYSAMGLDEGIVYDCSGYGRNCNVTGTMTADSSSPRYCVAAKFDQTVYASGSSTTSEGKTLSLWIKCDPTALANHVAFIDYRSMLAFGFYNSYACITTVNNTTCKQIYNKTLIPSNIWTHIAVVRDMTTPKMHMYINGVEQMPISGSDAWGSGISDGLTIGARTNGNNKFYGSMSDVRIYCTALSAEDIKALYETSVSIDDKGNFHSYEISEV